MAWAERKRRTRWGRGERPRRSRGRARPGPIRWWPDVPRPAPAPLPLRGLAGALDGAERDADLSLAGGVGDLLHGLAVAVPALEVHPRVDARQVAPQDLLDEADALDETAPVERRQRTEARDRVVLMEAWSVAWRWCSARTASSGVVPSRPARSSCPRGGRPGAGRTRASAGGAASRTRCGAAPGKTGGLSRLEPREERVGVAPRVLPSRAPRRSGGGSRGARASACWATPRARRSSAARPSGRRGRSGSAAPRRGARRSRMSASAIA